MLPSGCREGDRGAEIALEYVYDRRSRRFFPLVTRGIPWGAFSDSVSNGLIMFNSILMVVEMDFDILYANLVKQIRAEAIATKWV